MTSTTSPADHSRIDRGRWRRQPIRTWAPGPAAIRDQHPPHRLLMAWLAEHHTMTAAQIATALFPSVRAAQKRLTLLYRIEALDRFAFARTPTDTGGLRYTLGPLGDLLHPQPGGKRSLLARRAEVARNPKLEHLLGVNGFFTDLYGHARTHLDAHLHRWWGEARAASVYTQSGIHPDGHGIWQADGRTVGFFLEHDRGTEALRVVIAKLTAYNRLAVAGPRYPVLIHLPTAERETNLHHRLAEADLPVPVATSTHDQHPADPVWALAGATGICGARLHLSELPSNYGPEGINNPRRFQPQN